MDILLIEDNVGDSRLLQETLRDLRHVSFDVTVYTTLASALDFLSKAKPDIALLDLGLPDACGLEGVREVRRVAPHMPVVVLTALKDERLAVQSLQEGAQDYLVKNEIESGSLWRTLRYAMERQRLQLELLNLSLVDDLTGLNNRRGFLSLANHHSLLARRTRTPFLVGYLDLDGMKQINDTFGHQEGNRALVDTADLLRDSFRQSDILGRLGGDEFAVVISDADMDSIETVSERVRRKVFLLNSDPSRKYQLSLSIGLVAHDEIQPPNIEELLERADSRMYEFKRSKQTLPVT